MEVHTYRFYFLSKLEPDREMEHRLSEKIISKRHKKFVFRPIVLIPASLAVVICVGIFGYNLSEKNPDTTPTIKDNYKSGIYVPKIQLPKNTNSAADMEGLIVYQGKIYTQAHTKINLQSAKNLLGE